MIKLVLTDIDNTLVPLGNESATEHAIAGVHALLDAGIHFGPATGRDLDGMERFFRGDADCYATGLISNGKLVYLNGELVKANYLDHAGVERLCEYLHPFEDSFALLRANETDYTYSAHPDVLNKLVEGGVLDENTPDLEEVPEADIVACTVVCMGGEEKNKQIVSDLAELCPNFELLSPTTGVYDVVPVGWNKATALQHLCDLMDISLDEVCVFGDSENDVPMLKAVPNSVAVANSMPSAAKAARWHIGASADDAVADALFEIAEASLAGRLPSFMQ